MDLFPNETILFQWFLFMTALLALHWGVFRPILRLLEARQEQTIGEKGRADQLLKKGENLTALYETQIAKARESGLKHREEQLKEAESLQRGIIGDAKKEVDRELEKIRLDLDQQSRHAALELKKYSQDLAKQMAEKILERNF